MALVLAAMSGGVDSTLAAALCLEQGHEVMAVTLLTAACDGLGSREASRGRTCCGASDSNDARTAAAFLGIEHRAVDARDAFLAMVIEPARREQRAGRTPNPCILCNEHIKFELLVDLALDLGADRLVTGHYARLEPRPGGPPALLAGVDRSKDQSYVLFSLAGDRRLCLVGFPLGHLTKRQVRDRALALGLPNAARPESQDLCFPVRDPADDRPGPIVDLEGNVLGTHDGLSLYTVGQHRRIRVASSRRMHVVALSPGDNAVVVGDEEDLFASCVHAPLLAWDGSPPTRPVTVSARVRYRQPASPAVASVENGTLVVRFDEPQRGVAPGQALVCQDGPRVLGGGFIARALP